MKRKVVKIGPSTLVVSLPSAWARKLNIKKGDEVDVSEKEQCIVISGSPTALLGRATMDISQMGPIILRSLGVLYKAGYNEFKIFFDDGPKKDTYGSGQVYELDLIKKALDYYTGIDVQEIKKVNGRSCVIAVERAEVSPEEFDRTMNQAFMHLKYMAHQSLEGIKNQDRSRLKDIKLYDDFINKATTFCIRVLSKKGHKNFSKIPYYYAIADAIEQMGDEYRDLYQFYAENKTNPTASSIKLFEEANECIDLFYSLYSSFDRKKLTVLASKNIKIMNEINDSFKELKKDEIIFLFYVNTIVRRLHELLEPLMALHHEKLVE